MTQSMDGTETTPTQDSPQKRVKFYRHRRIVHPLLISLVAFVIEPNPFVMFMAYVVSGLLWDWVVFSYDGCKDSDLLPESAFEAIGITGQQLDELNNFQVDVRRSAFAASVAASAATCMFLNISWEMMFMFTYMIVTISSMIIATKTGKIICLYVINYKEKWNKSTYPINLFSSDSDHFPYNINLVSSNSDHFSSNSDHLVSDQKSDSYDPTDITSSAAYWPGGVLDPNKFNSFSDSSIGSPSTQEFSN